MVARQSAARITNTARRRRERMKPDAPNATTAISRRPGPATLRFSRSRESRVPAVRSMDWLYKDCDNLSERIREVKLNSRGRGLCARAGADAHFCFESWR